jgi:hypothetical protein
MPAAVLPVLAGTARPSTTTATAPSRRRLEQMLRTGSCAHPVRLQGHTHHVDLATGEVRTVYSSDGEPDRTLLVACGNRRAARCPSCAETYRADTYQLVKAGLRGGKGVPEQVACHPTVFATFTAPSFGPVHTRREHRGRVRACRPRHGTPTCPHGRPACCFKRHAADDGELGQALCRRCFDYQGLVLWNALAPELWRRTTEYAYRELARLAGLRPTVLRGLVRVSFAKVAEYQQRGAVHFHAVIRLDAAGEQLAPPPEGFTVGLLEQAIRAAAARVFAPCPKMGAASPLLARWGTQLDIRPVQVTGELSAERVAGYIAKYATKATESFGPALDHPLKPEEVDELALSPHVRELVQACWLLGGHPDLAPLRLRRWAHMLGFGGHWSTKSRRYSTTLGLLRQARTTFRHQVRYGDGVPLDAWDRPMDDDQVLVLKEWTYTGSGYRTIPEALLADQLAAQAREHRRLARHQRATA